MSGARARRWSTKLRAGHRARLFVLGGALLSTLALSGCDPETLHKLYCQEGNVGLESDRTFEFGGRTFHCGELFESKRVGVDARGNATPIGIGNEVEWIANARPSTDGRAIVKLQWDLDRDGDFDAVTEPDPQLEDVGASLFQRYESSGVKQVLVRATDGLGRTGRDIASIRVVPADEAKRYASFTWSPSPVPCGSSVVFDASASRTVDSPSYRWDFDGDGAWDDLGEATVVSEDEEPFTYTPRVSHTYPEGATREYRVRLRVRDEHGGITSYRSEVVRVLGCDGEPPPPQCSDGMDNDGDGLIDFPDDPGCDEPGDDDEADPAPPPCPDPPCPAGRAQHAGPATSPGAAVTTARPAGRPAATRQRFSARLESALLPDFDGELDRSRRGVKLRNAFEIGNLTGRLRGPRGARSAPIQALLKSSLLMRYDATLTATGKLTVKGIALAGAARTPAAACVRYRMTARRNRPATGRLKLLGGSDALEERKVKARFRFTPTPRGARLTGTVRTSRAKARPLPRACRVLASFPRDPGP